MSDAVVSFRGLTHYYGGARAVHDLCLDIPRGSVFALLGRNGAGKTTAIKCLMGLLRPTRGSVEVLAADGANLPPDVRARIGYVAEGQRLVPWMKVGALVDFQASAFATFEAERCRAQLARLELPERATVRSLSRGQRAQLALALALAPRPELVVLDDPAMGLDAVVRREFLEVMIDLIQEEGRTVLFSSHILADVERVADRVAILDRGVLRVNAGVDTLKDRVRRLHASFPGQAPGLVDVPGVVRAAPRRNELLVTVLDAHDAAAARLAELGARHVECERISLDEIFYDYVSGAARSEAVA